MLPHPQWSAWHATSSGCCRSETTFRFSISSGDADAMSRRQRVAREDRPLCDRCSN